MREPRKFIQVLSGPRQVGKTTLIRQLIKQDEHTIIYTSADEPQLKNITWLEQQWMNARMMLKNKRDDKKIILVVDEIQKLENWSETVKKLWDEDTAFGNDLYVILLGSSRLIIHHGLTESLAGRFEVLPILHWTFKEMKEVFGMSLEEYCYFGGYPGAASLIHDENRWKNYIIDSLIETTLSKDILLMNRIEKPALLRRVFQLSCSYSGKILSFQKMLGQLVDAGNVTTLSHYLDLLSDAGLVCGLQKYSGSEIRVRSSSPKLQVFNTALSSALNDYSFHELKTNPNLWGHSLESMVGADLLNRSVEEKFQLLYWRERNVEVDFVIKMGKKLLAIEIKSGAAKDHRRGLNTFLNRFPQSKLLSIGGSEFLSIENFLLTPIADFFNPS
jgi:predicted AAA+ superfamily ATPase